LIINGAGGVGSIAIQLAKWAGLTVIATASRPETLDQVKKWVLTKLSITGKIMLTAFIN
jgi:NADPH:quinone reductase-like Zn-dependent oxidoreductase